MRVGKIFISYRRDDSAYAAGRLYDRLSERFGEENIFMDVEGLDPGVDFFEALEKAVSACDVLIALIGKQWLDIKDEYGQRRLDNPEDFVRIEISAALDRDIRVIPILVQGARMPGSRDLPPILQHLARLNAFEIRHDRFNADVDRLARSIEDYCSEDAKREQRAQEIARQEAQIAECLAAAHTALNREDWKTAQSNYRQILKLRPTHTAAKRGLQIASKKIGSRPTKEAQRMQAPTDRRSPLRQRMIETLNTLPRGLWYLGGSVGLILVLVLACWGVFKIIDPFPSTETPQPISTTPVAKVTTTTDTPRPAAASRTLTATQTPSPTNPATLDPSKTSLDWVPLPAAECQDIKVMVAGELGVTDIGLDTNAPFKAQEWTYGEGCLISVSGTGADFSNYVFMQLKNMLENTGWTPDPQYGAESGASRMQGFRKDNALMLVSVGWRPSSDANCPQDRPILDCSLTPEQQIYTITLSVAQNIRPSTATATLTPSDTATPVPTNTPTPTQVLQTEIIDDKGIPMALVPAGPFEMGNDADVAFAECQKKSDGCLRSWYEAAEPIHTVILADFYIDQYEVTNEQFATFLNEQGNQAEGGTTWLDAGSEDAYIHQSGDTWQVDTGYADHPVALVSWYGAQAYCAWRGARLPTEAEWEKAARGGLEGALYPWGDEYPVSDPGAKNGAHYDNCEGTVPVGSFAPNGYGLYDVAGNIWEWVADWFDREYYARSPKSNPTGPENGYASRVLRGGSWCAQGYNMRVAFRTNSPPSSSSVYRGFRCVRSSPP
jgi:formylglycine-generating enzyme required for sulfatase activity